MQPVLGKRKQSSKLKSQRSEILLCKKDKGIYQKIERACNDLPCTIIDSLLPSYDLSTITKQVTTYDDGSFDHT